MASLVTLPSGQGVHWGPAGEQSLLPTGAPQLSLGQSGVGIDHSLPTQGLEFTKASDCFTVASHHGSPQPPARGHKP